MKKLDQFILKSFIGPFFAILAIVIFILVMQFLWLYIDELVGKGLELKVILEFLMWGSCQVLPLALPLATLLASMMTFGDLGEHYELTAMNSAGISLARILLPVTIASALIAVAAFFIGDRLVPYSSTRSTRCATTSAAPSPRSRFPSGPSTTASRDISSASTTGTRTPG